MLCCEEDENSVVFNPVKLSWLHNDKLLAFFVHQLCLQHYDNSVIFNPLKGFGPIMKKEVMFLLSAFLHSYGCIHLYYGYRAAARHRSRV